jgi:hypothetical protein
MTPNEFKAWFDGFTEAFEGRIPTKAQWGRIKDRVAEIDGKAVTERVYVDRYYPTYIKTYPSGPYWASCGSISTGIGAIGGATGQSFSLASGSNQIGSGGPAFNSMQAMTDLGRAEARALAA